MQVIILLLFSLISSISLAEFSTTINVHANAVTVIKAQVSLVGDAQVKFKELMAQCAPKKIANQEELLICGQKFRHLNLEFKNLKATQVEAEQTVTKLPSDFSASARALKKTLQESAKILALVTDTPDKTANSLYAMNAVYVQKQFEREYRDAFNQGRIRSFCGSMQAEIDTLVKIAQLALSSKVTLPTLFKQHSRLRNTQLLAKNIYPICKQTYNTTSLDVIIVGLQSKLTPAHFSAYIKTVCKNPNPASGLNKQTCEQLPLTPYSIQWLELAGDVK